MGESKKGVALIRCRSCWSEVDARELGGRFLERTCPACGERLSEDHFDEVARAICRDVKQMAVQKSDLGQRANAYRKRAKASWLRWIAPLCRWWASRSERAQSECAVIDNRLKEATGELRALAHDRYYVSEWFQCTRIPLVMRNSLGQTDFELDAVYTKGGEFRVWGKGATASGYEGEFSVFEALRKRISDPASPLSGARLLPNLFLPHDGTEGDMKSGRWNQVDCVVATSKGAFVVEAKRWRARVSTTASFNQLYVARSKVDNGMYKPAEQILRQIERTAGAFGRISPYPDERVFRAVVFVRPQEFSSDADDFAGRVLVSRCESNSGPFVRAIERKLAELDAILEEADVDAWADDALLGFGDLHGTYRELAERKRFQERKHAETHQRRRKGTRAHSARKHQGEKRRRDRKGESKRNRAKKRYDEWEWDW